MTITDPALILKQILLASIPVAGNTKSNAHSVPGLRLMIAVVQFCPLDVLNCPIYSKLRAIPDSLVLILLELS